MTDLLTNEEKIDYIYKELKVQKQRRYFGIFIKVLFVFAIIYFYLVIFPSLNKDKIISVFTGKITDIVKPITENLVKDLQNNVINENINLNGNNIENTNGINQDMINGLLKNLKN